MTGIAQLIHAAFSFQPGDFQRLETVAPGTAMAVWVAVLAGLSQGVGEAFVLFVNRVRPHRFALSLLVEALLFGCGFLAWALSTWLAARLLFGVAVPLAAVVRALGLAHTPQLLAFLGALPYLGVPWLTLLSLWTAVLFVLGLVTATGLSAWGAFWCLLSGWLAMHALQRSAGQPVMALGRRLQDWAAGVTIVSDGARLQELLRAGPRGRR